MSEVHAEYTELGVIACGHKIRHSPTDQERLCSSRNEGANALWHIDRFRDLVVLVNRLKQPSNLVLGQSGQSFEERHGFSGGLETPGGRHTFNERISHPL